MPNIISGSSAGSIAAALVGVHTKNELKENIDNLNNINWNSFF